MQAKCKVVYCLFSLAISLARHTHCSAAHTLACSLACSYPPARRPPRARARHTLLYNIFFCFSEPSETPSTVRKRLDKSGFELASWRCLNTWKICLEFCAPHPGTIRGHDTTPPLPPRPESSPSHTGWWIQQMAYRPAQSERNKGWTCLATNWRILKRRKDSNSLDIWLPYTAQPATEARHWRIISYCFAYNWKGRG